MCHNSVFDTCFVDEMSVEPLTNSTSRVYNPCLFLPLKTSFDPFLTLMIPFFPLNTYPLFSKSPREIKFLLRYLTLINNFIGSSWSLNLTYPIPAILQTLLFPSRIVPPSWSHNSSITSFLRVMCQVQLESMIHSLLELLLETNRTSYDS